MAKAMWSRFRFCPDEAGTGTLAPPLWQSGNPVQIIPSKVLSPECPMWAVR